MIALLGYLSCRKIIILLLIIYIYIYIYMQ